MKKRVVGICLILILFFLISAIVSECYAAPGIISQISIGSDEGTNEIRNLGGIIVRVVQVVGTAAALIMLVVCAVNFMMASPDGKAEYKKRLTPIVIGSVVLFGASNILSIIEKVIKAELGD